MDKPYLSLPTDPILNKGWLETEMNFSPKKYSETAFGQKRRPALM